MTPLISKSAAAALLSISAVTLMRHVQAGRLRMVRVGKLVRFDPQDLAAFIAARKSQLLGSHHQPDLSSPTSQREM